MADFRASRGGGRRRHDPYRPATDERAQRDHPGGDPRCRDGGGGPRRHPGRDRVRRREGVRGRRRHQGDGGHVLRGHGSSAPAPCSRRSPRSRGSRSRWSRPSPGTPSAAAASWRSAPTSGSPPTTRSSASRRSCSASSRARAAPSGCPGWSAPPRRRTSIFTGRFVGADEALQHRARRQGGAGCRRLCRGAARGRRASSSGPAFALRAAKEAIDRGLGADLDTGLEIERQQFAGLFATEDRATGMASFMENGPGKATFEGR